MMQFMFYYLMIIINFLFMKTNHPMSMGLTLLMQTLMISINSSMINCWYSYMLFIIFIGGMLVLFIYVTSLASNEIFSFKLNIIYFIFMLTMLTMMFYFIFDKLYMYMYMNQETNTFNMKNINNDLMFSLYKLYNFPTNLLSILLMIYLLITLIASVKITLISMGPLRQSLN
uniref:NADH-ubiquinone oxidoreductase chain 6 n=1 Tax=Paratrichobius longicrus TaxID=402416 RepID=A0A5B9RGN4_9MUSC|nr:NADH dehydrogenase subunit 6 [Paratrichobius longicrus]QEG77654.1 NADH dehydrogenase subunit 6 [Paratrichobius longicrus]